MVGAVPDTGVPCGGPAAVNSSQAVHPGQRLGGWFPGQACRLRLRIAALLPLDRLPTPRYIPDFRRVFPAAGAPYLLSGREHQVILLDGEGGYSTPALPAQLIHCHFVPRHKLSLGYGSGGGRSPASVALGLWFSETEKYREIEKAIAV